VSIKEERKNDIFEASLQTLVLPPQILPLDQQGEAFIQAKVVISGVCLLLLPNVV
jgi:hypothetical protein